MKRFISKLGLLLIPLTFVLSINLLAKEQIYTSFLSSAAAGGYDVVAYFRDGKPVKGIDQYKLEYKGADWYFSSKENLEAFEKSPESYAPQYGGYCAWAVAQGSTAKGDPLIWTIHNGKLYLNYNQDIQNKWLKDIDHLITEGDKNWPAVIQ